MPLRRDLAVSLAPLLLAAAALGADGAWEPILPPNPGSGTNLLFGVSALAQDDAWAVGQAQSTLPGGSVAAAPLALRWDGAAWTESIVPIPTFNGVPAGSLQAVEAIGLDDAWAAGSKPVALPDGAAGAALFILRWDGKEWSEVETPLSGQFSNYAFIFDIEARAADDVWFVGSFNPFTFDSGVVLHYDGSSFTVHETPDLSNNLERNLAVSLTAESVWVAGMHGQGGVGAVPYVLRGGNDGNFAVVASWPQSQYSTLRSIHARADDDVWIGMSKHSGGQFLGYVWLHFDGVAWSEFAAPPFHSPRLAAGADGTLYSAGYETLMRWDERLGWTDAGTLAGVAVPQFAHLSVAPDGAVIGVGSRSLGGGTQATLAAIRLPEPPPACAGDLDDDGAVGAADLAILLASWGGDAADLDGDGTTDAADLATLLAAWGPCR